MIKGREVDLIYAQKGFEAATKYLIREILETQMALNQSQTELASAFIQLANSVNAIASGAVTTMRQVRALEKGGKFEADFEDDKTKS